MKTLEPMNKREIITLMHKLFRGDIDTSNEYVHLFKNNELNETLFENFIETHITSDSVLIYLDSNNAVECKSNESYTHVNEYLKSGRVRIADPKFKNRVLIEPTGVGIGSSNK